MKKCRALIKKGMWSSPTIHCHKNADHEIVAIHPETGEEIIHGKKCKYHAEKTMKRYFRNRKVKIFVRKFVD